MYQDFYLGLAHTVYTWTRLPTDFLLTGTRLYCQTTTSHKRNFCKGESRSNFSLRWRWCLLYKKQCNNCFQLVFVTDFCIFFQINEAFLVGIKALKCYIQTDVRLKLESYDKFFNDVISPPIGFSSSLKTFFPNITLARTFCSYFSMFQTKEKRISQELSTAAILTMCICVKARIAVR